MRSIVLLASLTAAALAQPAPRTADEIIERSIAATGGREALDKSASTYTKAILESGSDEPNHGVVEYWAKAPNKRLIVMNLEDYGEIRNGFDGERGWSQDPVNGLREITGAELAQVKRDAVFRPELKWRDMYSKAELTGKRKRGGSEVYVVKLTPRSGKPEVRFYDTQTFLLAAQESYQDSPGGPVAIKVEMSDYRDVDGVKVPFRVVQSMPMGNMVIRIVEVKNNLPIEDSMFGKPGR